jgi:hypothetical protein
VLVAPSTRDVLARARAAGDARAGSLWRLALGASFAAEDPGPRIAVERRSEARFGAVAAARIAIARRLGFDDVWALARAVAGEADEPIAGPEVPGPPGERVGRHPEGLAAPGAAGAAGAVDAWQLDPGALVRRVCAVHEVDPGVIRVELARGDAPVPGRTFIVEPRTDVRIRVWWRPGASVRGVARVLLHELGHGLRAALSAELPAAAEDEGVAAWTASLLEREAFVEDVVGVAADHAAAIAAAERTARGRRRARLGALAHAELAFYRHAGPPPWRAPLPWTDPGASASYAAAERVRERLDRGLGAGWPTAPLSAMLGRP